MGTPTRAPERTHTTEPRRSALSSVPALAGICYSLSWLVGLSIFSPSTDVSSSGRELLATYTGHREVAMTQFVLTEGLAGVTLAVVVYALVGAARATGEPRLARVVLVTGLAAAAISVAQCALGLYLVGRLVPDRRAHAAHVTYDSINRLDGVKMFLLAGTAAAGFILIRRRHPALPRWLAFVAVGVAVSIAISAVGYLLLLNTPALAAWVSLPLLLIWVTGTGIGLGRLGVR